MPHVENSEGLVSTGVERILEKRGIELDLFIKDFEGQGAMFTFDLLCVSDGECV